MKHPKSLKHQAMTLIAALATLPAWFSCNDSSQLGTSVVQDDVAIIIDSAFNLTGHSIEADSVRSRTITQLLGSLQAPGFGELSSSVVTQFMPAIALDTTGVTVDDIDSLKLSMIYLPTDFTGDSIVPIGINVHRIIKDLPSPIYSLFDPKGYYSDQIIGSTVYSMSWNALTSTEQAASSRSIDITLPRSLGQELFAAYKKNPAIFASPSQFAKDVFKGLYIKTSYGSGRILRVSKTLLNLYYHRTEKVGTTDRDTIINCTGSYFAVTPEIVSNNNIKLTLADDIKSMVAKGNTVIAAPAGLDAEVVFPAREIIANYRKNITGLGIINSLTFELKLKEIENKYDFGLPGTLLMVLKKDKSKFFADNNIADGKTSFYATYNSITGSYIFTGMRQYILDMLDKSELTDEDVTFILTPITLSTETSQNYYYESSTTVTAMTPFISYPVMGEIDYDNTKITLTYSKQTILN